MNGNENRRGEEEAMVETPQVPDGVLAAGIRVLLVEDDSDSALATQAMLRRRGLTVTTVCTCEEAFAAFRAGGVDIVVSDIRLGGGSGIELLRMIREVDPLFPVILVTGYDSLKSAIDAVRLGAQDYILKPLNAIEDLVRPIIRSVQNYRLTQQNQALQQTLRESECRVREVLDSSSDVVFRYNAESRRFDYLSAAAAGIFEKPVPLLLKMNLEEWSLLVHPDHRERVVRLLSGSPGLGGAAVGDPAGEFMVRGESGQVKWVQVRCNPLRDGRPGAFLVGSMHDVTDRKERERDEDDLRQRLAQAEKLESLGLLASGVAHDLNNSLVAIVGMPGVLRRRLNRHLRGECELDPKRMLADLEAIQSAGEMARRIVSDLLTMGRRANMRFETVDLNGFVEDLFRACEFAELRERAPTVSMTLDLDETIHGVSASVAHLTQVVMNLVTNAVDAMPEGGKLTLSTREVTLDSNLTGVESIPPGAYALLAVRDSGCGIAPEHLLRIFEPFYTTKRMGRRSGSGLGLSVVYSVVKDHSGYLDVVSPAGAGTEFRVYLPVTAQKGQASAARAEAVGGRENLLLVDDARDQREWAGGILTSLGYAVHTVSSGTEALDALAAAARGELAGIAGKGIDLVILDLAMDGMSGLETLGRMAALYPGQKCILASGAATPKEVEACLKSGAGAFVPKPYSPEEIDRAIRSILDSPDATGRTEAGKGAAGSSVPPGESHG